MRILHYTTQNEVCGIATYAEQFIHSLRSQTDDEHLVFPVSPNHVRELRGAELESFLDHFETALLECDVLHIQHEFSFFGPTDLERIVQLARRHRRRIVVTMHTTREAGVTPVILAGHNLKAMINYTRGTRRTRDFDKRFIRPLLDCDVTIVHNREGFQSLQRYGVPTDRIRHILIPLPNPAVTAPSSRLHSALNATAGDVVIAAIGFIGQQKGTLDAVKMLSFLPPHFKLAIIGGVHRAHHSTSFMNELCDHIVARDLVDRVHITGVIPSNDELHALVGECDVAVLPLNPEAYKHASSGSIGIALRNGLPVVAYRSSPLAELNENLAEPVITFCDSPHYYELANQILRLDIARQSKIVRAYASANTFDDAAKLLAPLYAGQAKP